MKILRKYKVYFCLTSVITIKSTLKAACFSPIWPSSGLTIRTGLFTPSTFWDPKLFDVIMMYAIIYIKVKTDIKIEVCLFKNYVS
jgi:hypothetical protein